MVKHSNLDLEFPFISFFTLATAIVLLIFTLSPYYRSQSPPPPRTCPDTEYLNCVPGPGPSRPQCQKDYLAWIQKNCPGFKGVAY